MFEEVALGGKAAGLAALGAEASTVAVVGYTMLRRLEVDMECTGV